MLKKAKRRLYIVSSQNFHITNITQSNKSTSNIYQTYDTHYQNNLTNKSSLPPHHIKYLIVTTHLNKPTQFIPSPQLPTPLGDRQRQKRLTIPNLYTHAHSPTFAMVTTVQPVLSVTECK